MKMLLAMSKFLRAMMPEHIFDRIKKASKNPKEPKTIPTQTQKRRIRLPIVDDFLYDTIFHFYRVAS